MHGSSSKGILLVHRRVRGPGWRVPWPLGAALRRPLAWWRSALGRKHPGRSGVARGIPLLLLVALAALVGAYAGVLGMAFLLAVLLVLAGWCATVDRAWGAARQPGPVVSVLPGQAIPADGEIVEGVALVDEFARTGISSAVLREPGGERAAVLGGTHVLSGHIRVRLWEGPRGATQNPPRPA